MGNITRSYRIFIIGAILVAVLIVMLAAYGGPFFSALLTDAAGLALLPFLLIAIGYLYFLSRARRSGEMPKSLIGQFLYASFGIRVGRDKGPPKGSERKSSDPNGKQRDPSPK